MVFQPKHGVVVATLAIIGLSAAHALTPVKSKQKPTREHRATRSSSPRAAPLPLRHLRDEQLWTDTLRLHEIFEKSVDPTTALSVGLKVDADVLPAGILQRPT